MADAVVEVEFSATDNASSVANDLADNVDSISTNISSISTNSTSAAGGINTFRDRMSALNTAAGTWLVGGGFLDLAQGFVDVVNAGRDINQLDFKWESLAGPEAETALQNLREATNFTVPDTTLIEGAYGRISERMQTLIDDGTAVSDAWDTAFNEEMTTVVTNFETMSNSALDRLVTKATNLGNLVAEGVADALDDALGFLEITGTVLDNTDLMFIQMTQGPMAAWREAFRQTNEEMITLLATDFSAANPGGFDLMGDGTMDDVAQLNVMFTDLTYAAHRVLEATGQMPGTAAEIEAAYREITGYTGAWTSELQAAADYMIGFQYAQEQAAAAAAAAPPGSVPGAPGAGAGAGAPGAGATTAAGAGATTAGAGATTAAGAGAAGTVEVPVTPEEAQAIVNDLTRSRDLLDDIIDRFATLTTQTNHIPVNFVVTNTTSDPSFISVFSSLMAIATQANGGIPPGVISGP